MKAKQAARIAIVAMGLGLVGGGGPSCGGATFHVSPAGDDARDGRSAATAWRTVARAVAAPLGPGDAVRFERGGEWHERLIPPASGAPGRPITFEAYGAGPKPRFWGSDPVAPGRFEPAPGGCFRVARPGPAHAVLVDHAFFRSSRLVTRSDDPTTNRAHVATHPGTWFADGDGLLIHPRPGDGSPPRGCTVVARDDVVASAGRDHLVFRDLVVDESARFDAGYGFRIMGSVDVRLERCEAYRAGKHHFGVINSTGFVGADLVAAVAMPDQGAGGASAYVTYSDRTRRGDTSEYVRCRAERLDDPATGGPYPAFVTHGEGVGAIGLVDFTARGGEVALGNGDSGASIRMYGGRLDDATLRVDGRGIVVDALTVAGPDGAVILDGTANVLQNLLVVGGNPGFRGHQAAITAGGRANIIRGCTVVLAPEAPDFDAALSLKTPRSGLRWHGNVLLSNGTAVRTWFAGFDPGEVEAAANCYAPGARFDTRHDRRGGLAPLDRWQALGLDRSSFECLPEFVAPRAGDYTPAPGSPLIDAWRPDPATAAAVVLDHRGRPRPRGAARDVGAFEAPIGPPPARRPEDPGPKAPG